MQYRPLAPFSPLLPSLPPGPVTPISPWNNQKQTAIISNALQSGKKGKLYSVIWEWCPVFLFGARCVSRRTSIPLVSSQPVSTVPAWQSVVAGVPWYPRVPTSFSAGGLLRNTPGRQQEEEKGDAQPALQNSSGCTHRTHFQSPARLKEGKQWNTTQPMGSQPLQTWTPAVKTGTLLWWTQKTTNSMTKSNANRTRTLDKLRCFNVTSNSIGLPCVFLGYWLCLLLFEWSI